MTSMAWKRLGAMGIGALLAPLLGITFLIAAGRLEPVWLWNNLRLERALPAAEDFRKQVLASLTEGSLPEWCGSYAFSSGFGGPRLDLGPGGFYYEQAVDYGPPFMVELAYGKVASVDGGRIRLEFLEHVFVEREEPREGQRQPFRLSAELCSVPWGVERFLVSVELMPEFCRLVHASGWDSMAYADYPRRIAPGKTVFDRRSSFEGLPDVPAEFRGLLPE